MKRENWKEKYENLSQEINRLKLKMRSKENIIRSIIKKLNIQPPYDHFANSLRRMNFDDLALLEDKLG